MAVLEIVQKPYKNFDFCQYRNDVCAVMATFLVMARLTSFLSTTLCVLYIIQSAYVHIWPAEK